MNCQIQMTARAKEDLPSIAFYIFEQSKDKNIAVQFVKALQEECNLLRQFPESGSIPRDRVLMSMGYRYLVYKDYLVFYLYKKEENTAYIMAVFNGKRDYVKVMKKLI